MSKKIFEAILALTLALLQACTTTSELQPPENRLNELLKPAVKAENAGNYRDAYRQYMDVAASLASPEQESVQLRAISALISGQFFARADSMLDTVDVIELGNDLILQKQILVARLALAQDFPEKAVRALALTKHLNAHTSIKEQAYSVRAEAYARAGNPVSAIRERIFRDVLLSDPALVQENQLAIINTLVLVRSNVFPSDINGAQAKAFKGWQELAKIYKNFTDDAFEENFNVWALKFSDHPVAPQTLAYLANNPPKGFIQPTKIAVILPFNSTLGRAADAVFSGIVAAHYQSRELQRPQLAVYDNGNAAVTLDSIIEQAIADGADLIIGPLDKPAVNRTAKLKHISTPIIALNYTTEATTTRQSFYQFGLLPEEDARQTAEQAVLDGRINAAMLYPDNELGYRLSAAFRSNWRELGGNIVAENRYDARKSDFTKPIKELLAIAPSEQRHRSIEALLGQAIEFSPRRRQDIDFIFLVASPTQGRLIKPQLRFYRAEKVPVYATSHIYDAGAERRTNADLNGVIFCDMPWTVDDSNRPPNSLTRTYSKDFDLLAGSSARLFALGVDAYSIVPYLTSLRNNRGDGFDGLTGYLTVNPDGQFRRELVCNRFKQGKPHPLPGNTTFSPFVPGAL